MRKYTLLLLLAALLLPAVAHALDDSEALLEEAQTLRSDGDLDGAADLLDDTLEQLSPDDPFYQSLHLERHFHLRMARIRAQLAEDDVAGARQTHTEVRRFLRGHPQRSRFMSDVDRYDLVIRARER
ncbi:hypothetical protein [Aquisalimonas asiatica]|uniref:Tetratricopeptide repeat-containing protein n=1 Tax=Aquisalimonas asiatica TaxID=406100 RepID=A0A1H8Q8X2_9GAMM|nr:hypothetical protein [Aquisalimonas asiatica]SEO50516.1 hypothetical protein SAMN04488052_101421 [Aquisalimonas asiatica]